MKENTEITERIARYAQLRTSLNTGDLVLFSSAQWWNPGTLAIRLGTWSRWSHVGMVVHLREWDLVLLWESNTSNSITDISEGTGIKGVQLLSFSEVVRRYQGRMAIRHLEFSEARPPDFDNRLATFRRQIRALPYEQSLLKMALIPFKAAWNLLKPDATSFFCSELVAEALAFAGVLDLSQRSASTFAPKHFQDDAKEPLPLAPGFRFSKEIPL